MNTETVEIETESCCFDLAASCEQSPLQDDEVGIYATNHANERIYMVVKRAQLREMAEAKN